MKTTTMFGAVGAICLCASSALAGFSTTDSSRYVAGTIEDRFEARMRLDGGNSQTWKTAFWDEATMLSNSGIKQNVFNDGQAYDFRLDYSALTGDTTLTVFDVNMGAAPGDLILNDDIDLSPDKVLAGFRFFVRSESDGSTTEAFDLMASVNGEAFEAVPSLTSAGPDVFVESDRFYFDRQVDNFTMTGSFRFDWLDATNIQGERFKFSVKLLEGALVPTPGSAALAACGLGLMLRPRRAD